MNISSKNGAPWHCIQIQTYMHRNTYILIGPYGFLRGYIWLNYWNDNLLKAIIPLITKGYGAISTVVVFEFEEGGRVYRSRSLRWNTLMVFTILKSCKGLLFNPN
jgi:hypothetical protein